MRKLPRSFKTVLVSLFAVIGLLGTTAPAQSLDLGPSSNYLIRVTPEAKAAIEKTLGQYGGKIDQRYQYVFDGSYRDWETDRKSTRLNSSHRL